MPGEQGGNGTRARKQPRVTRTDMLLFMREHHPLFLDAATE